MPPDCVNSTSSQKVDDELAQLRWAILEEKRRFVRMLIKRVTVGKGDNGKKRKIKPQLSLDMNVPVR